MLTIEASNINEMKLKQTETDKFTKSTKMELKQAKANKSRQLKQNTQIWTAI